MPVLALLAVLLVLLALLLLAAVPPGVLAEVMVAVVELQLQLLAVGLVELVVVELQLQLQLLPAMKLSLAVMHFQLEILQKAPKTLRARLARGQNLWPLRPTQSGLIPQRWQTFLQSPKRIVCALRKRC